jgi:hypothetical protein
MRLYLLFVCRRGRFVRFGIVVKRISVLEIEVKVPGAKAAVSAGGVEDGVCGVHGETVDTQAMPSR